MNESSTASTGKDSPKALLSVSDKTGVVDFARSLYACGFQLLSTGGTAKALRDAGLEVMDVSAHTGFPEIMGGRVKTLHPKVHGGILARRGTDDAVMAEQGIDAIDLVVVNLYPFAATIAREDCSFEQAIENIDIGGPAMIRAAAKNHRDVLVVTDPQDYPSIASSLAEQGSISSAQRISYARKAFAHTADYDATIASYLGDFTVSDDSQHATEQSTAGVSSEFPDALTVSYEKQLTLRYGENPHQQAAFYAADPASLRSASNLIEAERIQGKELSYNNIADVDAALAACKEFEEPACVIVKHANPCGVAVGGDIQQAYERAFRCDPTSAFGGIIAVNRTVDHAEASSILDNQFVEVLLASEVTDAAREVLASKPAVRVLQLPKPWQASEDWVLRSVSGGLLVQSADHALLSDEGWRTVTTIAPDEKQLADLLFAWRVAKHVKSNAIVYARDGQTIGVGAGQMSRVYSARIAAIKAADEGLSVQGAALASDAFFPFRDGIDQAAAAGVSAIIQPGGSRNDEEVITAANDHGIAMVFTGMRHFKH